MVEAGPLGTVEPQYRMRTIGIEARFSRPNRHLP
jgi:hypothetical protein